MFGRSIKDRYLHRKGFLVVTTVVCTECFHVHDCIGREVSLILCWPSSDIKCEVLQCYVDHNCYYSVRDALT